MEENTQAPQQIITPTPLAARPPHTKLFAFVAILIGILLLLFIAPTPYYQSEEVSCKPGQTNCPQIGWHWNKPLYQSLLSYVRYSPRSQNSQVETSTPSVSNPPPAETPSADSTATWKTYNYQQLFEIKIPNDLKIIDNGRIEIGDYLSIGTYPTNPEACRGDCSIIETKASKTINGLEVRYLTGWWGEIGGNIAQSYIEYLIPQNGKYIYLQMQELPFSTRTSLVRETIGKVSEVNSKLLDQILSTFKFTGTSVTPTSTPTVTPTTKPKTTYAVPTSWKRLTTQSGLNLCMPPKWEVEAYDHLIFNRDEGYKPSITYITNLPYSGGSRREAYFAYWVQEYPDVKKLVSVADTDINGNSALTIYPANSSDPKTSPEGLTVVWYATGKLWKAGLSGWNMTNTSQTSFLKDFYTMISCSF